MIKLENHHFASSNETLLQAVITNGERLLGKRIFTSSSKLQLSFLLAGKMQLFNAGGMSVNPPEPSGRSHHL